MGLHRHPGFGKRYSRNGRHLRRLGLGLCHQKSSFATTRRYRTVCLSIERSYSGRADHRHHYRSISVCRTDPVGDLLAELSDGGLAGETAEAGEKGVGHIPAILCVIFLVFFSVTQYFAAISDIAVDGALPHYYLSFHSGIRFSKKAFTPSLASSVVQSRAKASFMYSNAL